MLLKRQDLLVNHQDNDGDSALITASGEGMTKCVKLLLDDRRTDVNLVNVRGQSVLWAAYRWGETTNMKLLISYGANIKGIVESVLEDHKKWESDPSAEAVMKNWESYLPEFTRYVKSNKYYPHKFKECAFTFILSCLRSKAFPKDIIYLLLEYIARAWKLIK